MARNESASALTISGVDRTEDDRGTDRLRLRTEAGAIEARLHPTPEGDAAILWVFGAGGGLGGPAGGLYTRLGAEFRPRGVASLEVAYRHPGRLRECVRDVLTGIAYLASLSKSRIVLVGHSFGGAVVIQAGALSPAIIAVAALSSQTGGAEAVGALSPKPVLFIHGGADEILPDTCSRSLYARAREPKRLIVYPGCRHGLDQCREALDRDLTRWLEDALGLA